MDIILLTIATLTLWVATWTLIMTTVKIDFAERWRHLISWHLAPITGIWINGKFNPEHQLWTWRQFTGYNIEHFNIYEHFSFMGIFWAIIFYFIFYRLFKNLIITVFHKKLTGFFTTLLTDTKYYNSAKNAFLKTIQIKKYLTTSYYGDSAYSNEATRKENETKPVDYLLNATFYRSLIFIHILFCIIILDFPHKLFFGLFIVITILLLFYATPFINALIANTKQPDKLD